MPSDAAARSLVRTAISRLPGARPAEVRHDEAGEDERDEAHERPPVRVGGGVDGHPEELAPCRSGCRRRTPSPIQSPLVNTTAWIVKPRPRVTIARFTPRVRSAGSAKSRPTGIGEQHAEGDRELHREIEAQHERARDQRARARERPLPERELSGVAREHHDRQHDDRRDDRDVRGGRPPVVHHRRTSRNSTSAGSRSAGRGTLILPGAELREGGRSRGCAAAGRGRAPRARAGSAGTGWPARCRGGRRRRRSPGCRSGGGRPHASPNPTMRPPTQRERERPEPAEQRGGHRGDGHDERERDRRQAGERGEQHAGEPGERRAHAPRDRRRACSATSPSSAPPARSARRR